MYNINNIFYSKTFATLFTISKKVAYAMYVMLQCKHFNLPLSVLYIKTEENYDDYYNTLSLPSLLLPLIIC